MLSWGVSNHRFDLCGSEDKVMAEVLIADDDTAFLGLLTQLLEHAGHHVEVVPDGAAALARATSHHFDALIADIVMPNMDGLELIRTLQRRQPELVIIAVSGSGGAERGHDYLRAAASFGAAATVPKHRIIEVANVLDRLLVAAGDATSST
jgi:CheY-like chemotaxis protein